MSRAARQQEMEEGRQEAVEAALAADREAALRDVFAAAALAKLIPEGGANYSESRVLTAREAYRYADAMMQVRKENKF